MYNIALDLAVRANAQQLAATTSQIRSALSGVSVPVGVTLNPTQLAQAQAQLAKLQSQATATASALGKVGGSTGSAAGIGALGAAAVGLGASLRSAAREAIEFNKTTVQLSQVSEDGSAAVRGVVSEVGRLSQQYGVSSGELIKVARDLKSAGFSISETSAALSALSKASLSSSFGSPTETANGFIAAVRQFDLGAGQYEKTLGSINALSNSYAAESKDLTDGVRLSGSSFKAAGGNLNEYLSLLTVARSASREAAPQIAEALKILSVRLQRGSTIEELRGLGIELRRTADEAKQGLGAEGTFVGPFEAVQRLSRKLGSLPVGDPRGAGLLEKVAGADQLSRITNIIQQAAEAEKALAVARAGEVSLSVGAAQGQDAYAVRLAKVREQVLALTREAGDSRGFALLIDSFERGATAAAQLARALGPLVPLLAGVAAYRLGAAGLGAAGLSGASLTRGRLLAGGGLVAASAAPSILESTFGPGRGVSAVGGAFQGGAVGALVGSAGGPLGAALGGAVGAVVGFTTSLRDAAAAIRQAAIENDLTEVRSKLLDAKAGDNPAALTALNAAIGRTRAGIEADAAASATNFVGRFDPAEFGKLLTESTLKQLGPQLVPITEALSKQADLTGRRNPTADPDALAKTFQASNAELLKSLASVKGTSPAEAAKDFASIIRAAQSSAGASNRSVQVESDSARATAGFARLLTSVEAAADSIGPLAQRGAALSALGEGSGFVGPAAINPTDPAALARLLSPLGPAGGSLLSSVQAGRQLRDVLPAALAQAASGDALEGGAVGAKVRSLTLAALGGNLSTDQSRGLDSVVEQLDKFDVGQFRKRAQADPNKLTSEVLSEFLAPIEDTSARLAKLYDESGRHLADALTGVATRVNTAGESLDRAADLRLASLRQLADVRADRTGGRAIDSLSLADLNAPFRARQERLTGRQGGAAFDVADLAARLSANRSAITNATADRDRAAGTPDALKAASALSSLATEGSNLQRALANLANASERAAGIQDKLNAANANRDGRLSYAERYLTASPEEQARLRRGQALVSAIDTRQTSLRDISVRDRRLFFESARDLGQVVLPSGRTGADVARRALGEVPGVLDPRQERERGALQDKLGAVFKTAESAQRALADFQRDTSTQLAENIRTSFDGFLARLASELASGRVSSARAEAVTAGDRVRELREQSGQRSAVTALGIPLGGRDDLDKLKTYREKLAQFAAGQDELNAFLSDRQRVRGADFAAGVNRLGGIGYDREGGLSLQTTDRIARTLVGDHRLPGEEAGRAAGIASARFSTRLEKENLSDPAALRNAFNQSVREGIDATTRTRAEQLGSGLRDPRRQLSGAFPGLDFAKLTPSALKSVDEAIATFGKAGNSLEGLDGRIRDATDAHTRAAAAVGALEAAAKSAAGTLAPTPREVVTRANGGAIGTDTVPAMLTPGEFVVRREAAQRIGYDRLRKANESGELPRGYADGGPVKPPDRLSPERLRRLAEISRDPTFAPGLRRAALDQIGSQPTYTGRPLPKGNPNLRGYELEPHLEEGQVRALTDDVINPRTEDRQRELIADRLARDAARKAQAAAAGPRKPADPRGLLALAVGSAAARQSADFGFAQSIRRGGFGLPGEEGLLGANAAAVDRKRSAETERSDEFIGGLSANVRAAVAAREVNRPQVRTREVGSPSSGAAFVISPAGSFAVPGDARGRPLFGFASGGSVPGATDTVPAMLTPGEFVFSRPAVQSIGVGNLDRVHRFAAGGLVPGAAPAGQGGDSTGLADALKAFGGHVGTFDRSVKTFGDGIARLEAVAGQLGEAAEKLAQMPTEVSHTGEFTHQMTHNGTVSAEFSPESLGRAEGMVQDVVDDRMRQANPEQLLPVRNRKYV